MKHIAKFAPIITISWQINKLEKILTGPGKLSGVSRNGPQASSHGNIAIYKRLYQINVLKELKPIYLT